MTVTSAEILVDTLRQHRLLGQDQVRDLQRQAEMAGWDAHRVAQAALSRDWLTPYQVNQLLKGHGAHLRQGPYILLERLGEGGMGQVFKARHRRLDRIVALKIIRPDRLVLPAAVHRFRREVQAVAQLSHPNIILALDADEVDGAHFYVMEYAEGVDLWRLVRAKGPLSVGRACDYARQAALGLQHVHENGLVHRDIKPSNLILTKGQGVQTLAYGQIKILDLGLARFSIPPDHELATDLTHQDALIGSPDYLAPEQAADPHAADIRADLYSLGCTLYFLLTGRTPFPNGSPIEKVFQHRMDEPDAVEQVRPGLPTEVGDIVRKLMAKQPGARYKTPGEVAAVLKPWARPAARARSVPLATLADPGAAAITAVKSTSVPTVEPRRAALRHGPAGLRRLATYVLGGGLLLAVPVILVLWLLLRGGSVPKTDAEPLPGEGPGGAALRQLIARARDPQTDLRQLRHEFVALSARYPGTQTARRVAELLPQLPSPLDALDPRTVPPEIRFGNHPGGELVLLFGDTRLRHGGPVWAVALSPDGKRVFSGGEDRQIYQWDSANGKCQAHLTGHEAPVTSLACAPDGRTLVSVSHDWTARLWDVAGRKERRVLRHPANVRAVAVAADSKLIATGSNPAAGQSGGSIRMWDMDGKELYRLDGHQGAVLALAFVPNGPLLVSAGEDKSVRLWDLNQRKELANWQGHQGHVLAVAFSRDGQVVVSGGQDKTLRFWDVAQRKERSPPRDLGFPVAGLCFLPKASLLAVAGSDGTIRIWDVSSNQEKAVMRGHHGGVLSVTAGGPGPVLASGGHDGTVRLWDPGQQKELPIHRSQPPITAMALAPDDQILATGHQGGRIRLWDMGTMKERAVLDKHQHGVPTLAFSPDGKTLLSGGWDHLAILWDVREGRPNFVLPGHRATVVATAFTPDGSVAVTASHDSTARLWDVVSGRETGVLQGHTQGLSGLAVASDGKTVGTTSPGERSVRVWDLSSRKERANLGDSIGEALSFLPDGRTVVSGTWQHAIRLNDVDGPKGSASRTLPGVTCTWFKAAALALDGQTLAIASGDGRLVLWNLARAKEQSRWSLLGPIQSVALAADGRHVICLLGNGSIGVLRLAPPPDPSRRPPFALASSPAKR